MWVRTAWCVLATALWASHSLADPKRTPELYERVDAFVSRPLGFGFVQPLNDLRQLGKVRQEVVRAVPNSYNKEQIDEVRMLHLDGLVIHVLFPGRDYARGLVWQIEVTKPTWKLQHGLNVGARPQAVEAVLGEPDEKKVGEWKYCGDRFCGTFLFHNRRIQKITFQGSPE